METNLKAGQWIAFDYNNRKVVGVVVKPHGIKYFFGIDENGNSMSNLFVSDIEEMNYKILEI